MQRHCEMKGTGACRCFGNKGRIYSVVWPAEFAQQLEMQRWLQVGFLSGNVTHKYQFLHLPEVKSWCIDKSKMCKKVQWKQTWQINEDIHEECGSGGQNISSVWSNDETVTLMELIYKTEMPY